MQSTEHSSQYIERVGTYSIRDREVAEQTHAVSATALLNTANSRGTGAVALGLIDDDRSVVEGVTTAAVTAELNGEILVRGVRSAGADGRAELLAALLGERCLTSECWTIEQTLTSGVGVHDTTGVVTADGRGSSACCRVGGSAAGVWSRRGRNRGTWSAHGDTRDADGDACVRVLFALSAKLLKGSVHQYSVLKCSVLCKEKEKLCVIMTAG